MPNLYEITAEYLQFIKMVEELKEQGADQQTIDDTIESGSFDLQSKVSTIAGHIKNINSDVEAYKAESKRLAEKAKQLESKAQYWTNYIDGALKAAGIKELKDGVHEIKYRKGLEVVEIDEDLLPERYVEEENGIEISFDLKIPQPAKPISKAELKKYVKSGYNIPGISLVRKEDSIQIK